MRIIYILFLTAIISSCASTKTEKEYCLENQIISQKECHAKWLEFQEQQRHLHQRYMEERPYFDRR